MPSEADVRPLMEALTEQDIADAMLRLNRGELSNFAESIKYDVLDKRTRKPYPPKRVVGLALERLARREMRPADFKGGELSGAFRVLHRLKFDIQDKAGNLLPNPYQGNGPRKSFKYGEKAAWELTLDAVHALGGVATKQQVADHIKAIIPEFNTENVGPDLSLLTVNSRSRGNYGPNERPRSTDEGSPYDALFVEGKGSDAKYVLYQPSIHGVWELAAVEGDDKLRPQPAEEAKLHAALEASRRDEEAQGAFDPSDATDARKKTLAAIVQRQGQGKFRRALVRAYGGCCAVTGCDVEDTLEAAHIQGYLGARTNVASNGLLLRADIHTLFDLRLLCIDPDTFTVIVAPRLRGTDYGRLHGTTLRVPRDPASRPNREALRIHGEESLAF